MLVNPKKGEGPSFKVTRRTVDHYLNYYLTFLKENYHRIREKMKNLIMHDYYAETKVQNFNILIIKWKIQRQTTSDNMLSLLRDFEKARGKCFSYSAFTDHINSCLEPRQCGIPFPVTLTPKPRSPSF